MVIVLYNNILVCGGSDTFTLSTATLLLSGMATEPTTKVDEPCRAH